MKKHLSVVFVVLAIMAMLTSTVSAAPAQAGKNVELVSIQYLESGIVLTFHTSGLTEDDLKNASFFASSNSQNMYCNFIDDTTDVHCEVAKSLAENEGKGFHGTLAGIGFWGSFPTNTYCDEDETKVVNLEVYENGELVAWGDLPLEIWNDVLGEGWIEFAAQYGIIYKVMGQSCSSEEWGPS